MSASRMVERERRNATMFGFAVAMLCVVAAFGYICYLRLWEGVAYGQLIEVAALGIIGSLLLGATMGAVHFARSTWGE